MKLLNKGPDSKPPPPAETKSDSLNLDLNYLLKPSNNENNHEEEHQPIQDTSDDFLVDISDEKMLDVEKNQESDKPKECASKIDVKLNDIFVKLENIKPSSHPPLTVLEKNDITLS